jgi:hypothetical protein
MSAIQKNIAIMIKQNCKSKLKLGISYVRVQTKLLFANSSWQSRIDAALLFWDDLAIIQFKLST